MNQPQRVRLTLEVNLLPTDPFAHTARLVAERIEKCINWNLPMHDAIVGPGDGVVFEAALPDGAELLGEAVEGADLLGDPVPTGADLLEVEPDGASLLT